MVFVVVLKLLFSLFWVVGEALHVEFPAGDEFNQIASNFPVAVDVLREFLHFSLA